MDRKKKLALNTTSSIIKQVTSVVCAFILPRLFLTHYGSKVNGLVSSITQFLSLISIFDAGMGVVIEASLYGPLAQKNEKKISQVLSSGQQFYRRFVVLLLVYVICLSALYPFRFIDDFDYLFTASLIISISISSFGQYALGVTNSVLLSADQKSYINFWSYTITTIINTLIGTILICNDCSVQIVKLFSSMVFLIRPLFLALYVKKHYRINWKEKYTEEPIKQKWNGFTQHIAALVVSNTDTVVLTFFSSFENVSIYTVYFLVINSVKEVINAASAGVKSLLGDMLAKEENKKLHFVFEQIEWSMHGLMVYLFSMAATLIVPFVKIYTKGVNDANYDVPLFSLLLCIAYLVYCARIPYFSLIQAAGHFKETQRSAIVEAIINLGVSILVVSNFGLIGVACGTLVAMLYRLIYLSIYAKKKILHCGLFSFIKLLIIDVVEFTLLYVSNKWLVTDCNGYTQWIWMAIKVSSLGIIEIGIINFICYKSKFDSIVGLVKKYKK